jgi:DNA adenine methylase
VTIETWHEQSHALKHSDPTDTIALGFAAFFLNRTNHSGILRARPIGGLNQDGPYKIDCRFNKTDLLRRLRQIARLAARITVHNDDAVDLLVRVAPRHGRTGFVYADPPYLKKSTDLYLDTMTYVKHEQLSHTLATRFRRWIVSYDCDPRVGTDLYPNREILRFGLRHSAGRAHRGTELMVFSPHINPDSAAHLLKNPVWQRRHRTISPQSSNQLHIAP